MEVHFNPDSIANVLVIKNIASIPELHRIMDSRKEHVIIGEYQNHITKLRECRDGLNYYDAVNKFTSHINSFYYLSTAKDKKEYFIISEIQVEDKAIKVQR